MEKKSVRLAIGIQLLDDEMERQELVLLPLFFGVHWIVLNKPVVLFSYSASAMLLRVPGQSLYLQTRLNGLF